jgi:hypothetical protein
VLAQMVLDPDAGHDADGNRSKGRNDFKMAKDRALVLPEYPLAGAAAPVPRGNPQRAKGKGGAEAHLAAVPPPGGPGGNPAPAAPAVNVLFPVGAQARLNGKLVVVGGVAGNNRQVHPPGDATQVRNVSVRALQRP